MSKLLAWVNGDNHLPAFLRDFHAQKDVFKTIASVFPWKPGDRIQVDWTSAHIYVIDKFLRFMALHGWTIQRTRCREEFCDIHQSIATAKDTEAQLLRAMMSGAKP